MTTVFGKRPAGVLQPGEVHPTGDAGTRDNAATPRAAGLNRQFGGLRIQDWITWLLPAAFGAAVAFYTWRVILAVPYERPFGALFSNERQQVGWAPWWIAPLVSTFVAGLIAKAMVWQPGAITLRGILVRSACVAYAGVVCARLVRNLAYVVLFVPGATWLDAAAVLPQMIAMHVVQSAASLATMNGLPIVIAAAAISLLVWLIRYPARIATVRRATAKITPSD